MKFIKLHNSDRKATVDDKDFDRVNEHRWYLHSDGSAVAIIGGVMTWLQDFILGTESDHNQDAGGRMTDSETVYELLPGGIRQWVMAEADERGWSVPEFIALLVKGIYTLKIPHPEIPSGNDPDDEEPEKPRF